MGWGMPLVAKNLRLVLRGERLRRLQFDNQAVRNEEVRQVISDQRAVLVIHFDGMLWLHVQARLAEPVGRRVFIDFLQVPLGVIDVNC